MSIASIASAIRSVYARATGEEHRREASALRADIANSLERSAALREAIDAAARERTSGDNYEPAPVSALHA